MLLHHRALHARRGRRLVAVIALALAVRGRHRLLPAGRRRPDEAALPRAAPARASKRPRSWSTRSRQRIRQIIPADELETINDMIGVPISYNLAFVQTDNVGAMDAEILIALKPRAPPDRRVHAQAPRDAGRATSPARSFYFQPADIVSQVLNFGAARRRSTCRSSAPTWRKSYEVARRLRDELRADPRHRRRAHRARCSTTRRCKVDVDRLRAAQVGLTPARRGQQPAGVAVVERAGGAVVLPEPAEQRELHGRGARRRCERINSVPRLMATPLTPPVGARCCSRAGAVADAPLPQAPAQTLGNVADAVARRSRPAQINHYTVQRVIDVGANVEGRDLGSVAERHRARASTQLGKLPPGHEDHAARPEPGHERSRSAASGSA